MGLRPTLRRLSPAGMQTEDDRAREQLWGMALGPGGHPAKYGPALCPGTNKGKKHLRRCEQDMILRTRGKQGLSPLLSACQTPSGFCLQFEALNRGKM